MRDQGDAAHDQRAHHHQGRVGLSQHGEGQDGAPDRADHGVDDVPQVIDERDFIRQGFDQVQNPRHDDDRPRPQRGQARGRILDPAKVDAQPRHQDRRVKVEARCERQGQEGCDCS